jgi:ABC-type phosphate transport system substrate-binding protein
MSIASYCTLALLFAITCYASNTSSAVAYTIAGAGATFPSPVYNQWYLRPEQRGN